MNRRNRQKTTDKSPKNTKTKNKWNKKKRPYWSKRIMYITVCTGIYIMIKFNKLIFLYYRSGLHWGPFYHHIQSYHVLKQVCICNPQLSLRLPTDRRSLPNCLCISTGILNHQFLTTGLILRVVRVCTYIMVWYERHMQWPRPPMKPVIYT